MCGRSIELCETFICWIDSRKKRTSKSTDGGKRGGLRQANHVLSKRYTRMPLMHCSLSGRINRINFYCYCGCCRCCCFHCHCYMVFLFNFCSELKWDSKCFTEFYKQIAYQSLRIIESVYWNGDDMALPKKKLIRETDPFHMLLCNTTLDWLW